MKSGTKSRVAQFRVTDDEYRILEEMKPDQSMSMSDFLRGKVFGDLYAEQRKQKLSPSEMSLLIAILKELIGLRAFATDKDQTAQRMDEIRGLVDKPAKEFAENLGLTWEK